MCAKRAKHKHQEPDVFENFLERSSQFVQQYWRHGIMIVAVIVLVLLGYRAYTHKGTLELAQTADQLNALPMVGPQMWGPDPDEAARAAIAGCKQILSTRWETDATPWVLLKLANAQRSLGLHDEALKTYDRLRREHETHQATRLAAAPRAATLEDARRYEEAALAYEGLAGQQGNSSAHWVDAGRAWELAHNREAAIEAYSKLAAWALQAGAEAQGRQEAAVATDRLDHLAGGQPMLAPPPQPPLPQTPALPDLPPPDEPAIPTPDVAPEPPPDAGQGAEQTPAEEPVDTGAEKGEDSP